MVWYLAKDMENFTFCLANESININCKYSVGWEVVVWIISLG